MKTKAFPHLACRMNSNCTEAGCDEAGRGCLAGPVFAAAVILPPEFECAKLNDSKQLSENDRDELRILIEKQALCFAVASCSPQEIDEMNILWAVSYTHLDVYKRQVYCYPFLPKTHSVYNSSQ